MDITLLLCDAVQVSGGKLFVLGGGWNGLLKMQPGPASMGLAVLVVVPWNETNQRHRIKATLVTQDGAAVMNEDRPVVVEGEFEVGRPPGTPAGSSLNVPLAINISVDIAPGGYRWELAIDGSVEARTSFTVSAGPSQPPPA